MLTKGIEVMKYVRSSAGRAGISIVFEEHNQPRHDGHTIYLPAITASTTAQDLKQMMASVDHEVGHDLYSDFGVLSEKKLDPNSLLMFVWNFLEDSRINVIQGQEYEGFRQIYDETSAVLIERILENCKTKDDSINKLVPELMKWETTVSRKVFPASEGATTTHVPDPEVQRVLSTFSGRLFDCQQIINKRSGTTSTYELAYDILKTLGKDGLQSCKKDDPRSSERKKGGKPVSKDGSETEDVTKSTSKSSESGEEDGSDTVDDDEYKILEVVITNEDLEKLSPSMPRATAMSKTGINFKNDPPMDGTWSLTDFQDFVVVDYYNNIGIEELLHERPHIETSFIRAYQEEVSKHLVQQDNFAQQVRRLIQIRARVQTQYGVKKGKLDQSRLSRICVDSPAADRVFKNRIENKTLDAAVSVLIDMSGSMHGMKCYYALASALLLNEVCSTLNIPVEITGFSDWTSMTTSVPCMFLYKSFNVPRLSPDKFKEYFARSTPFMTGNPDGENILWAYDRLLQRKEKNRLLIVMSDGAPAASKSSVGLSKFTLQTIKEIERAARVQIYGLGLCSNSVATYYKQHSVVHKANEIPQKLLDLIDKRIVNHV